MRKIIFLFAILCIAGVAFGQKEAKLVWEQELHSTIVPNTFSYFTGGIWQTSKGDIIATSAGVQRVFSKEGKYLMKYSDLISQDFITYGSHGLIQGVKINWSFSKEKVILIDKTFKILATIENVQPVSIIEIEDAIFLFTTEKILKYDLMGKEVWQYLLRKKIDSQILDDSYLISDLKPNSMNYTLYYHDDYSGKGQRTMIRIDGKNVTEMTIDFRPEMTIPTLDKGFWAVDLRVPIMEERFYIKYDSTGKKMFEINPRDIKFGISEIKGTRLGGLTPNSSLIFESKGKEESELFFVRVDLTGKIQATEKINIANYISSSPSKVTALSEDLLLFAGSKYSSNGSMIFGSASFSDSKINWGKVTEKSPIGIAGNQFLKSNAGSVDSYDLQGNLLWSQQISNYSIFNLVGQVSTHLPFYLKTIDNWKHNEKYLYLKESEFVRKIRISDGALMWRTNQLNDMRLLDEDKDGNSYWIGPIPNATNVIGYKPKKKTVFMVSNGGEVTKIFESPKEDRNLEGYTSIYENPTILIDIENKYIYTIPLEEQSDQSLKCFLRKYTYRCLYDLEATAQVTGKTEVCAGTKVKLSTTKQDGLTYQWQKDGKDIPTFKDIVHDVEESGNYTVTVKDEVCQNQAVSNAIAVTIKPTPEAIISTDVKTVIYEPFTVKMTANTGTGLSYQWLKDDVIIPNETSNIYEAKKFGKYNVIVMKDGCQKTSEALNISIQIALSAESEINEETVRVYPNPSRGAFNVILPKSLQNAEIQLFDLLGLERTLTYIGDQVQAEGLVQGTYFLRVTKGEKSVTNKIVVE